jgi:hypothetical protein
LADLGLELRAVDFGMHAGDTTNACFWLCLAAGLAASSWSTDSVSVQALLTETHAMDLCQLDRAPARSVRTSALGKLASTLRTHFCRGHSSVLMRPDMQERIYQAFAGLRADGPLRTLGMYERWVNRLAKNEFADELVIVAVAIELKIRIICVPFTPSTSERPWAITTYQESASAIPEDRNIYLGNNDVHYMWLSYIH